MLGLAWSQSDYTADSELEPLEPLEPEAQLRHSKCAECVHFWVVAGAVFGPLCWDFRKCTAAHRNVALPHMHTASSVATITMRMCFRCCRVDEVLVCFGSCYMPKPPILFILCSSPAALGEVT